MLSLPSHRMHSIPLSDRGPFVVSTSFYIQTIRRGEKSFDAAAPKIVTEVALFVCCAAEPIGAEMSWPEGQSYLFYEVLRRWEDQV